MQAISLFIIFPRLFVLYKWYIQYIVIKVIFRSCKYLVEELFSLWVQMINLPPGKELTTSIIFNLQGA